MITIRVVQFNGAPLPQPISCLFDEMGGTIGRADTNQLVLPDPERHISRLQARVVMRDGEFAIINQGANPILVNGTSVPNAQAMRVGNGDRVEIAGYLLEVSAAQGAPVQAPAQPAPPPRPAAPPPQAMSSPAPISAPVASAPPKDDPLGLFGASAPASGGDPFADILGGAASPAPSSAADPLGIGMGQAAAPSQPAQPAADPFAGIGAPHAQPIGSGGAFDDLLKPAPASPASPGVIPDDFDPFADPFAAPPSAKAQEVKPLDDLSDLGGQPATGQDIGAMFGLGPAAQTSGAHDPFAGSALGNAAHQTDAQNQPLDPLVALSGGSAAAPAQNSVPDQVPELYGSFVPPPVPNAGVPPAGGNSPQGSAPLIPADADPAAFLSWSGAPPEGGISKTTIRPSGRAATPNVMDDPLLAMFGNAQPQPAGDALGLGAAPAQPVHVPAEPARVQMPQPSVAQAQPMQAAQPVAPRAPIASGAAGAYSPDQLAEAFIAGLGVGNVTLPEGMTPEMMERVGRILREATQGTLDLLLARATTKREVRAEVTMIVSRNNNPLKFSPDVGVALAHLITPQGPGFMPPVDAMRDAYDDLRSHQFGFMAGLRAALAGVLKRFDPAVLETRLTDKSVLDSVLPMNRRAKLWDLYIDMYKDIANEAEDDFHTLFGREFLRAYQEQVAQLDTQDRRG